MKSLRAHLVVLVAEVLLCHVRPVIPEVPRDAPVGPPAARAIPAPSRWLRTDEITGDLSVRDRIDAIARSSALADGVWTGGWCGTWHASFRSQHPMPPDEAATYRAYTDVAEAIGDAEADRLAFHESPVVRAYFAPHASSALQVELARDATCVPMGSEADAFWEPSESRCVTIRSQAVVGLCVAMRWGERATPEGLEAIRTIVFDPTFGDARTRLLGCLEIGCAAPLAPLVPRLLASDDEALFRHGVEALEGDRCHRHRRDDALALAHLDDRRPPVRAAALRGIRWSRLTSGGVPRLSSYLDDVDAEVRAAATRLYLAEVEPPDGARAVRASFDPSPLVREAALAAWSDPTPRVVARARVLLSDPDDHVREAAKSALSGWKCDADATSRRPCGSTPSASF